MSEATNLDRERSLPAQGFDDPNEIVHSILSNMGDAVIVTDKEGKFLVFNRAAQRMFGADTAQLTLTEWSDRQSLYLPDKVTPFSLDELPLAGALRGEKTNNAEIFVRGGDISTGLWIRVNARPLSNADGKLLGGMMVCRDISEIKEEEFFRAGQSRVLEMIAADKPLGEVLTNLVLLMEGQAEGLRCSILLLSRDGKHVRHGAAPNLSEIYVRAVDGAPIGPYNGS